MTTFKNKNSLRTIEAQIVQKLKDNEARPIFTGSYKKKCAVGYTSTAINLKKNITKVSIYKLLIYDALRVHS